MPIIKVTESLKKHLRLPKWVDEVHTSNGYRWNGWLVAINGFSEFRAGLMWEVIAHILNCSECRKNYDKYFLHMLQHELKDIRKRWAEVMG